MTALYKTFRRALQDRDGALLGYVFSPSNPDLSGFTHSTKHSLVRRDVERELGSTSILRSLFNDKGTTAWVEVFLGLWKLGSVLENEDGNWTKAYEAQKEVMLAVIRGYSNGNWPHWTLPVMYTAGKYLRIIAIKSDTEAKREERNPEHLEDAARHINKMFTTCISDRAPLEESRKWGTYYVVNLLFKTYFKLNAITLSKNILRALHATTGDMPPLDAFPKSHIVTFKYYVGVISFLEEDYTKADENLTFALSCCHKDSIRNQERILTYLIPTHLITTHKIPSAAVLSRYPRLQELFAPIAATIKSGHLRAFDAALEKNEEEFVKLRIYLTLERGRDIAMRNLFRKVFLIGAKKTRISVWEFRTAINKSMQAGEIEGIVGGIYTSAGANGGVEVEEVECLLANMIYKGLMKGYISREKQMVVLSGKEAFPGTGV